MSPKTASESAFEEFCASNEIFFERISEGTDPTPDDFVRLNRIDIYVEVKQIDEDAKFTSALQLRTPGTHIRAKINQARNQVRSAAVIGAPAILLIYNNLDPMQFFGTEPHDFLAAMYGDLTLIVSHVTGRTTGPFHGKRQSFRDGKNDSFSALGRLYKGNAGVAVHLYENMYAKVPLDYESLPPFVQYNRVEAQDDA